MGPYFEIGNFKIRKNFFSIKVPQLVCVFHNLLSYNLKRNRFRNKNTLSLSFTHFHMDIFRIILLPVEKKKTIKYFCMDINRKLLLPVKHFIVSWSLKKTSNAKAHVLWKWVIDKYHDNAHQLNTFTHTKGLCQLSLFLSLFSRVMPLYHIMSPQQNLYFIFHT